MKHYIKTISTILVFVTTGFVLQGCGSGGISKQGGGTVIGGLAGGLLGSRFGKGEGQLIATGVGALAGALIGGEIGKTMDEHDRMMAEKSSQQALEYSPSGTSIEWHNPDSGNHGMITPTKTYKGRSGGYCREFTQEIVVGGEKKKAYGRACRQPDGAWKIVQ